MNAGAYTTGDQLHRLGKTIVMITHYFGQVKDLADAYVIFGDGQAVKKTRAEVFADADLLRSVREY